MMALTQRSQALHASTRPLRRIIQDCYLNGVCGSRLVPRPLRAALLSLAGLRVNGTSINPNCFFGGKTVSIAAGSFINYEVFFDCAAPIDIGRNCQIGMRTLLVTGSHNIGPAAQRAEGELASGIRIDDGCWLGANVTVLPGVSIGGGCVIAAGSVVTRNCEPNGLYAGVPARRIRDLDAL
jgi:maltose O-acetyltransferase